MAKVATFVAVDMAGVDAANEEAALQRARAIMVETATFGLVTDAHDARQRSTQEIAVATFTDDSKATYIFEYRDGGEIRSPVHHAPVLRPRAEAVRCAIDLLVGLQRAKDNVSGWMVRVRCI